MVRVSGESNPDLPIQSPARYLCATAAGYLFCCPVHVDVFWCPVHVDVYLTSLISSDTHRIEMIHFLHLSHFFLFDTMGPSMIVRISSI